MDRRASMDSPIKESSVYFPPQPKEYLLAVLTSCADADSRPLLVKLRVMIYISIINVQPNNNFQDWTTWQVINLLNEALYDGLHGKTSHKAPTRLLCQGLLCSDEEQEMLVDQIFSIDVRK
eukprot:TRINITY_DN8404_c0_g1_i4.p1 TRINITY_DN8404_c0_g1~~TRINITY_DN8404_c0_g1_i4.p1  ORF type:complete len:138 (+),score=17.86 TRINITY_DN8404_c0_g1_i4:52-414(+)